MDNRQYKRIRNMFIVSIMLIIIVGVLLAINCFKQTHQKTIEVDPETCMLRSKYDGDRTWSDLAQLPIPCEVVNE